MGRVRSLFIGFAVAGVFLGSIGCGKAGSGITPRTIHIAPSVLSIEEGATASVSVMDQNGNTLLPATITWQASVPAAVTVTTTGALCGGLWDSLITPTFCAPGPAGPVLLTASAAGATSAPITVYVHRHVERMIASQVGTALCSTNPPPLPWCISAASLNAPACTATYQVQAFNNNQDITSTLGPLNWNAVNSSIVTLNSTASGLMFNQVQATAKVPGQTQFYATAGNNNSTTVTFATCPVESVSLQTATGGTSLNLAKGSGAQLLTATVADITGLTLLNPPLTWTSTNPTVVSVTATGAVPTSGTGSETDSISPLQAGGAGISAACLPPACNAGFTNPPLPPTPVVYSIFPPVGISVQVSGGPVTTTVYSASSGCWDKKNNVPVLGCVSSIIPVDTGTKKVGTPIPLPHTPTSMLISASGSEIFVGSCVPQTQGGAPVCNGVAAVKIPAGTVTSNFSVTGEVIGVSPNGNKAVVSDTSTSPNLVFLYDQTTNLGTPLLLAASDHAKSATFSLDSSTVYIATCTALPCTPGNAGPVYVYDPVNSLRKLASPTGVTDVAFHPSGGFAYLAEATNSVTALNACNNQIAQTTSTPGSPQFLRPFPDGSSLVALNGPNATGLEIINTFTGGSGCPLGASMTVGPLIDLNQGPFVATQFLLSADGSVAYVIPQNFSSIFSYNIQSDTKSGIALVGTQPPTTAGLTTDGKFLYVGSTDSLLHVLDTSALVDTQQIVLSTNASPAVGMCSIFSATQPCHPDFVVIKP